jgi:hypothetical protein
MRKFEYRKPTNGLERDAMWGIVNGNMWYPFSKHLLKNADRVLDERRNIDFMVGYSLSETVLVEPPESE